MQLLSPDAEVCGMASGLCTTQDDRLTATSASLFSNASDAVVTVTQLSVHDVCRLLPATSCDTDSDLVLGGGTGVTDGLSASESLLTSRTSIASVQLTRLIWNCCFVVFCPVQTVTVNVSLTLSDWLLKRKCDLSYWFFSVTVTVNKNISVTVTVNETFQLQLLLKLLKTF